MPSRPDWMPEEELALLASAPPPSTSVEASQKYAEQTATQIFRDNAPLAAQVIVDIMVHSESERNRFQAAKYITERVLGRVGDNKPDAGPDNPWDNLFGSVIREPNADERASGARVSRL